MKNNKAKKEFNKEKFWNNLKWALVLLSMAGLFAFGIAAAVGLSDVSKTAQRIKVNNLGYGVILFTLLTFISFAWAYISKPDKNQTVVKLDAKNITDLYTEQTNKKIKAEVEKVIKPEVKAFTDSELTKLDESNSSLINWPSVSETKKSINSTKNKTTPSQSFNKEQTKAKFKANGWKVKD